MSSRIVISLIVLVAGVLALPNAEPNAEAANEPPGTAKRFGERSSDGRGSFHISVPQVRKPIRVSFAGQADKVKASLGELANRGLIQRFEVQRNLFDPDPQTIDRVIGYRRGKSPVAVGEFNKGMHSIQLLGSRHGVIETILHLFREGILDREHAATATIRTGQQIDSVTRVTDAMHYYWPTEPIAAGRPQPPKHDASFNESASTINAPPALRFNRLFGGGIADEDLTFVDVGTPFASRVKGLAGVHRLTLQIRPSDMPAIATYLEHGQPRRFEGSRLDAIAHIDDPLERGAANQAEITHTKALDISHLGPPVRGTLPAELTLNAGTLFYRGNEIPVAHREAYRPGIAISEHGMATVRDDLWSAKRKESERKALEISLVDQPRVYAAEGRQRSAAEAGTSRALRESINVVNRLKLRLVIPRRETAPRTAIDNAL